jgi:RNA polymerase sigma factor (sigma-70 family)
MPPRHHLPRSNTMPETWDRLGARLLAGYDDFVRKLTRRLGSAELAREAIHETYLRLQRPGATEPIQNPDGYLFRIAINIAKNRGVIERRYLNASEIEVLIDLPEEAPDPARTVLARSEMAMLQIALDQLPERQREIFTASWVHEIPHNELAQRYGVDIRTIQRDLERASRHVRLFWKENGLD